jgi:hypothetical protein
MRFGQCTWVVAAVIILPGVAQWSGRNELLWLLCHAWVVIGEIWSDGPHCGGGSGPVPWFK